METNKTTDQEFDLSPKFGDWVPRHLVKEFFNYGNTKMASFAKDHNVRMSIVGRRIFYKYSDVLKLLNDGLHLD